MPLLFGHMRSLLKIAIIYNLMRYLDPWIRAKTSLISKR